MTIQTLNPAGASTPRPAPATALTGASTNLIAGDSQAASFSRMLAQARQAAPPPSPAPAPAPAPAASPPSSSAPKEAADPAPRTDSDSETPADTAALAAPPATTEANGGERALMRKAADRASVRTPAARGATARVETPEPGADANPARRADKAQADAETAPGTALVNPVPQPWLAAPQQADGAANAALAGFGRAGQTTPLPPDALPADGEPGPVGIGLDGSPRKDPRAQAASAGREADGHRATGTAVADKPAEPAPLAEELPRSAQAVDALSGGHGLAPAGAASVDTEAAKTSASEAPAPQQASIATPLTSPEFRQALGVQISVLARDGVEHAELQLNPAEMGPISVRIAMEGDQARVDFGADLARTRDVIEAGWAELAASLQDAGFTLSGGGVSQQSAGRPFGEGSGRGDSLRGGSTRSIAGADSVAAPRVARATVRAGGIDLFA